MFEERIRLNKIRRERERKRHILIFISKAQGPDTPVYYKYYTSIRIEAGDTLWSLADAYADENFKSKESFIKEVVRTNHLLDDNICEGDYLIVPYYSAEFK